MTTNDLIDRLTGELKPVSRAAVAKRIGIGMGVGFVASAVLMMSWLGMRPDMMDATGTMPFWGKFVYTLGLGVIGVWAVKRIAYPLGNIRINIALMAILFLVMAMLAMRQLMMTPPSEYYAMMKGHTIAVCTFNIVILSVPLLGAAFWVLRGLGPTRLTLAGAAAGLAAGSVASWVYSFHCDESAMPFIAVWYTLGIIIPGLIGAIAGRSVLRW
ncbi:DUF1109 family protein [Phyllobacterium sp. 628]|uniref:NrsF family protein n=1 Tax=Phyllobacterium sp. 628 TaxID=2718938 RepID=UPI001662593C|nr:DUF1109 domain-containing protein [Phyllobacterium sp. 628]QND53880.1 DUF1109 family protein [Phyllobacterium sp. 628]